MNEVEAAPGGDRGTGHTHKIEGHRMTLPEFIEAYDYIVRAVVSRHIPRKLGDPEDLSQEIWTQFVEGKGGRS